MLRSLSCPLCFFVSGLTNLVLGYHQIEARGWLKLNHYILGVNITRENVSLCLLAVMKSSVAGEKTDCQAKLYRVSIKSCLSFLFQVHPVFCQVLSRWCCVRSQYWQETSGWGGVWQVRSWQQKLETDTNIIQVWHQTRCWSQVFSVRVWCSVRVSILLCCLQTVWWWGQGTVSLRWLWNMQVRIKQFIARSYGKVYSKPVSVTMCEFMWVVRV